MTSRDHLVPKTIVNALGHTTTVYVNPQDTGRLSAVPLSITAATPKPSAALDRGERIGEPIQLFSGSVEVRRLHPDRNPVHILTAADTGERTART